MYCHEPNAAPVNPSHLNHRRRLHSRHVSVPRERRLSFSFSFVAASWRVTLSLRPPQVGDRLSSRAEYWGAVPAVTYWRWKEERMEVGSLVLSKGPVVILAQTIRSLVVSRAKEVLTRRIPNLAPPIEYENMDTYTSP